MTLSRSNPRAKPRWIVALVTLVLGTIFVASSTLAAVNFVLDADDNGPNDEPNQKDLTAQASAFDSASPFHFFSTWLWDDTSWSGNNTGDGCSLFDTSNPDDGLVDYAVCVTVGTKTATELSTRVYSCNDTREDRCAGATLIGTESTTTWCSVSSAPGPSDPGFGGTDTQAICDISQVAADVGVAALGSATLVNSCSYPSQEPNSDPSDCVKTITNLNTSIATAPSGTATWTAKLNDTATMNPINAAGTVVFKLWGTKNGTTGACETLIWTSSTRTLASAAITAHDGDLATAGDAGSPADAYVITQATTDADLTFYWTVEYTPSVGFNGSTSDCVESTRINAPTFTNVP
jgi:hypothetical protein